REEPNNTSAPVHPDRGPRRYRALLSEHLVEQRFGFVLVGVLRQRQLRDEDLAGFGQHALLAGRQTAVTLPAPQVADHLGHLDDVAGGQLLEVGFVPTRPVGRLLRVWGTKDLEDAVQPLLPDDVADTDQIHVVRRDPHDEVRLRHDFQYKVGLIFALDLPVLDVLDYRRTMVGVDHRLADLKSHMSSTPSLVTRVTRPGSDPSSVCAGQRLDNRRQTCFSRARVAVPGVAPSSRITIT